MNNNLVLVTGKSATGKSACLKDLRDPAGVWYFNCENNKALPFKNDFRTFNITDPMHIYEGFAEAENNPEVHTIVVDSITYLMDMYESMYVLNSDNTMKAWGEYAQFFKRLMQTYVANSTKNVIMLAHTMDVVNNDAVRETLVKVKGSLMDKGIESAFSTVISTKTMSLQRLEEYKSKLLNITEDEEIEGMKYCFQVKKTSDTVNERIRGSIGMFSRAETFTDNNIQLILDRIHEYYI